MPPPCITHHGRGCPVHFPDPALKTLSALASVCFLCNIVYQPLSDLVPFGSIYSLLIGREGCWAVIAVLGSLKVLLGLA